jgi:hypothetical protein
VAQSTITSGTLTNGVWTLLGGYVSESVPLDPNITSIPGGLWDFNVWALGTANANANTVIRAKVYTYNGADAPTLLGTSGEQVINNVSAQFSLSVLVPQTTVTSTTRIYVAVEVKAAANNHTATLQFGDGTPSHVHTSLPLVGGTGLWKNVAGVLQSPASLIFDADVDAAAAISQSKIDGLTTALGTKAAKADVQIFTSNGTWAKPAGAKSVKVELVGGGGGGGSGRKGASGTTCGGGGSGAGGGFTTRNIEASLLGASVPVVVGIGGTGGAAQTASSSSGNAGVSGGNSTFGTWIFAGGGTAGGGGTNAGGTAGISGSRAMFVGGSGAAGGTTATAGAGGGTQAGGAGGGGGGGVSGTTPAFFNGGLGRVSVGSFLTAGDTAGGTIDGASGTAGPSVDANYPMGGNGGGGGAGSINAANNGGNGGAGGNYGAGGGGGGACLDTNTRSGAGGAGANGIVIVTTYF